MKWQLRAECRDVDPEVFFPIAGQGTDAYHAQVKVAKSVCSRCSVRDECLEFAQAHIPIGVAGGLDEFERASLRRAEEAGQPTFNEGCPAVA